MFEALALELVKMMPVHQVCKMLGVYDKKIWSLMKDYVELCRKTENFSEVAVVGVDETSVCKGHDYASLSVDLDEKRTIFVSEGKDSKVVTAFSDELAKHGGTQEKITQVSCDISPAFIRRVEENFPNADIVFDRFHITKVINEAVDKVRK